MSGFTLPAEWTPHERTLVAWPTRRALWGDQLEAAEETYARVITTVARFEPVTVVANTGEARDVETKCGDGHAHEITIVEEPIDDSWLRDNGPIIVRDAEGRRAAVDFRFNGWGGKWVPHDADDAVTARLCTRLGIECRPSPMVLEGGSITCDGDGTLVTTEQCLLHPNRNPSLDRQGVERALREWLGVERIVWLAAGLVEDRGTDGHVDNVCAWIAPGIVLTQGVADPSDPNAAVLAENRARLEAAGIEVVPVDVLPSDVVGGRRVVVPPLNSYFVNGGLVVPVARSEPQAAEAARERIAAAVPDREVVAVEASVLAYGGGGIHCITQQVPA